MRPCLAVVVPLLGGCSFIYNPDHINKDIDAKVVDTEHVVDVNPAGLTLTYAYPAVVYEGVGTGGSRPAVVVIRGEEIAPSATVTIVPMTGAPTQIALNEFKVADDHRWIALSITVPVDETQDETGTHATAAVPLAITVDNGMGHTATLPMDALKVQWLDQLEAPITAPPEPTKRYSKILVTGANNFAASSTAHRATLRSMSSIEFDAALTANASGLNPGPGGCAGGPVATNGGTATTDGDVCQPGQHGNGGGGGGYVLPGDSTNSGAGGGATGDALISAFKTNVGGGGGGGDQTLALLGGGAGGGGGGTLFLDAGGTLTLKAGISANGAAGSPGGVGGGGGGGAGGTILLRSGGAMSVTGSVSVSGQGGGTGTLGAGAAAHDGRVRFDAASITGTAPAGTQGSTFVSVPAFSTSMVVAQGMITLSGPPGASNMFFGQGYDKDGNATNAFDLSYSGMGIAMPSNVTLTAGYNQICVLVPNGNVFTAPESANCAEVAFLPTGN